MNNSSTEKINHSWRIPLALAVLCLATRLFFLGQYLEGWDSVNFALALRNFDLAAGQPHFPGYPIYIFFSRMALTITGDDYLALATAGALFNSLTILPLYSLAKRMFSPPVAILASLLFIANPMLWLQAEKAYSDAFGLFFIMAWACLLYRPLSPQAEIEKVTVKRIASRKSRTAWHWLKKFRQLWKANTLYFSSLFLGLALGVRLSYFPFLLTALIAAVFLYRKNHSGGVADGVYGLILGAALWLAPLLAIVGTKKLWTQGLRHFHGHFYQWGDTLATSVDLFARAKMFLWDVLANGLGFWWPDAPWLRLATSAFVLAAMILFVRVTSFDMKMKFILASLLPYAVWIFCGQNLNSPRHVLPLLPVLLICIAAGLWHGMEQVTLPAAAVQTTRILASAVLLTTMGGTALELVRLHKNTPPTRVQLVQYVAENFSKASTIVYCWNTKRLFDYYAPEIHTKAGGLEKAQFRLASTNGKETVLITSDHPESSRLQENVVLVKTFRKNRYVHNWFHELHLYALQER